MVQQKKSSLVEGEGRSGGGLGSCRGSSDSRLVEHNQDRHSINALSEPLL